MLNKIRDFLTSASMPHGKQAAEDSLKDAAAKIRAGWSGATATAPVVNTPPYSSPYATQVYQQGLARAAAHQQQMNQAYQSALGNTYAVTVGGGGGGNGTGQYSGAGTYTTSTMSHQGLRQAYYEPPKYDPVWRASYEAEREAASRAIMVEET